MICQACKQRTATIHLTEINNNQRNETHLCQECAQEQGLTVKTQIPLNELLSTLLSTQAESAEKTEGKTKEQACPNCGMTLKRFAKENLLGCPEDYKVFGDALLPLIEKHQNGKSQHAGKTPSRLPEANRKDIELTNLRKKLEQAIKNEDYETAARLRDQIQTLE